MTTDTSATLEFGYSIPKMLGLFAGGVALTAASAVIALGIISDTGWGPLAPILGDVGVIFFGLCTVICLWRLLTGRGPVVSMTPEGIRDIRVAKEVIPWRSIRKLSRYEILGNESLVLLVDEQTEHKLTLSRIAKSTRKANTALGADGLIVAQQGLNTNFQTLFDAATAYVQRYGPPSQSG
ncbi:MAG: STM3941 family protein [Rhizomicrobium sp.]